MPTGTVYGEPALFRKRLSTLSKRGRHLLGRVDLWAAKYDGPKEIKAAPKGLAGAYIRLSVEGPHQRDRTQWEDSIAHLISNIFGPGDATYAVTRVPYWDGTDTTASARFQAERDAIEANLSLLDEVRDALPRAASQATPTYRPRLDELRASGLVTPEAVDGYAERMGKIRTRPQMAGAIGASKEVVEATLKAALALLGTPPAPGEKFPTLVKDYRDAVASNPRYAPDPNTRTVIEDIERRAATLIDSLAPLRNRVGDGHGHLQYPKNLSRRHARLAADAAETYVRFIVLTLTDLGLL